MSSSAPGPQPTGPQPTGPQPTGPQPTGPQPTGTASPAPAPALSASGRRTSPATLGSKRSVLLLGLLGAALVLVSGTQHWVGGTVTDAVLGRAPAQATGSQVAPAALAAALAAGAAAVACVTSGRLVRRVSAAAMLLAAVLAAVLVGQAAGSPAAALRRASAEALGRRDTVLATGHVEVWLWVAAAGVLLVAVAGTGAALGSRRWSALPSRYDSPTQQRATAPERRPTSGTPWDQLSQGQDPTLPAAVAEDTRVDSRVDGRHDGPHDD